MKKMIDKIDELIEKITKRDPWAGEGYKKGVDGTFDFLSKEFLESKYSHLGFVAGLKKEVKRIKGIDNKFERQAQLESVYDIALNYNAGLCEELEKLKKNSR